MRIVCPQLSKAECLALGRAIDDDHDQVGPIVYEQPNQEDK